MKDEKRLNQLTSEKTEFKREIGFSEESASSAES